MARRIAKSTPLSGKDILPKALKKMGIWQEIEEQQVIRAFALCCNPFLLQHARGKQFSRGVLYVQVENSSWAQELSFLKSELLQQLQKMSEGVKIKDIRFAIGSVGSLPDWQAALIPPPLAKADPPELSNDVLNSFKQINDREIRESLSRLYQAWGAKDQPQN